MRIDRGRIDWLLGAWWAIMTIGTAMLFWATQAHCETKVEFTAKPQVSLAGFHGSTITLKLVIRDADEKLWCPAVEWEYPDSSISSEESDCESFDKTTKKDREFQSWSRQVRIPQGEWPFNVRIMKGGKTLRKLSATVTVR